MTSTLPGLARRRALVLGLLAAVAATIVAISPALADTETGETGSVGTHALRDTMDAPGVICVYRLGLVPSVPASLVRVRVIAPEVFARDLTLGTDRQRVGWRFIIERDTRSEATPWVVVFRSGIQKAFATDLGAAPFTTMSVKVTPPTEPLRVRVMVKMIWYRNGTTEGSSTHVVDFYTWKAPPEIGSFGPADVCVDGLGN